MSRLAEYRKLEQLVAQQSASLQALRDDPALEVEIEFETKLLALLGEYSKSLADIRSLLDSQSSKRSQAVGIKADKRTRRARTVKVYRNPLTGEIVESKGGNHKLLAAWKAQFGHEEVESWVRQ